MKKSEEYVTVSYLKKSAEILKQIKKRTYELMNLKKNDHVLDLGCGPGIDTVSLAKLVGKNGSVVGIDNDAHMVEEANEYAKQEGQSEIIHHIIGDVTKYSFQPNSFNSCRAERFFQVLPNVINPREVIEKIYQTLKPNGFFVVADADWATASVDFEDRDLERKFIAFFGMNARPNGFAGREFYRLFKRQGFRQILVEIFPIVSYTVKNTPFIDLLVPAARESKAFLEKEIDFWSASLEKKDSEGEFYSCVNMVVVAGQK